MARSKNEAFWWSLFAAGGGLAAMVVPVHIIVNGIGEPHGWVSPAGIRALVANPLVKLYLFALFSLPFFHCAHRIRHILYDFGLRGMQAPVAIVCYGAALASTLWAVRVILAL
ncbi:MAG: fumarate reductase subunit D [Deltaproteobacteria bacterium]|nr:fumarate reductase subunit D [Deltaproteobacteria bacterium]